MFIPSFAGWLGSPTAAECPQWIPPPPVRPLGLQLPAQVQSPQALLTPLPFSPLTQGLLEPTTAPNFRAVSPFPASVSIPIFPL